MSGSFLSPSRGWRGFSVDPRRPLRWGYSVAAVSGRKSFTNIPCALCDTHLSSRKGEHVLPQFLLRALFPEDPNGYYTEVGGDRVVDRAGNNKLSPSVARRQLPVCNATTGGTCNDVLAQRFEREHTTAQVLRYFTDPFGTFTAKEVADTGIWWLKTLLLCTHPQTQASDEIGPRGWDPINPALYSWLVDGSAPPAWLSVWMVVLEDSNTDDDAAADGGDESEPAIDLPHFSVGGVSYTSQQFPLGLRHLRFQLVHHPGWVPMNPFESSGQAVRLWPSPPSGLDLGAVPRVGPDDASRLKTLWGQPMGVLLDEAVNPLDTPWELAPGWTASSLVGAKGVTWG